MSQRFFNPYPQFFDSSPNVYSGGKLYFYAAGTSTPLDTYSDTSLSVANANPVVLGSAGRASTDVYLQDLYYKIILKDSAGNTIWTVDNYYQKDPSKTVVTKTGSGSPNGSVAGTAGSSGIVADQYWDYTNSILYVCTTTGTASTAVWTALNASTATASFGPPQGRLTLTSGTPILTSTVSAATTVYYTTYLGNLVPLYNGSLFIPTTFSELSLTINSSYTASTNYDVFIFSNSGVVTIATGPAWSSDTSRGSGAGTTQISYVGGLLVNTVSAAARNGATTYTIAANKGTYVGTIRINGSKQVDFILGGIASGGTAGSLNVWNMYNRTLVTAFVGDSTDSWNYTTATWRSANNSATMRVSFVNGLNEDSVFASYSSASTNNAAAIVRSVSIGLDSTSAFSSLCVPGTVSPLTLSSTSSFFDGFPGLGLHYLQALEYSVAANTTTWYGDNGAPTVTQNGLIARLRM